MCWGDPIFAGMANAELPQPEGGSDAAEDPPDDEDVSDDDDEDESDDEHDDGAGSLTPALPQGSPDAVHEASNSRKSQRSWVRSFWHVLSSVPCRLD